jgi:hypothetical protein
MAQASSREQEGKDQLVTESCISLALPLSRFIRDSAMMSEFFSMIQPKSALFGEEIGC